MSTTDSIAPELTLETAMAQANADAARINGNADLKTATWEETKAAEHG